MNDTPTPQQAAQAARAMQHQAQMELRAAGARTAADWVDIYQSVIEYAVKSTMEANGQGSQVLESLQGPRSALRSVRARLEAHGLPLTEGLECEGPELHVDEQTGTDIGVTWPHGRWLKIHFEDASVVEFRGYEAFVAITFIRWWTGFSKLAQQWANVDKDGSSGQSRLIEPGSDEWNRYYSGKAADLAKHQRGDA